MSEMSDTFKLVNAMELAKTARVGMELTYFDVIELMGELESLKEYITEIERDKEALSGIKEILREHIEIGTLQLSTVTARIAELKETYRWRVVADGELPEKCRDERNGELIPFLVCGDGTEYPFTAVYDGELWNDGMFVVDITHWMPLPELPEVTE